MNIPSLNFNNLKAKYGLMLVSGLASMLICLALIMVFLTRSCVINNIKGHFDGLERFLQSIGYDFAYDRLDFYKLSPWQVMRVKNFRIYSLDEKDFWQWQADEVSLDVGLFTPDNVELFWGGKQSVQHNSAQWEIGLPLSKTSVVLKDGALKNLAFEAQSVKVKNLMDIEKLSFSLKHRAAPYLAAELDVKGVKIDDMTGWPLNKNIDHIYLNTYMQGEWDSEEQTSDAFYRWIEQGGNLAVSKLILNWKPLITVANGEVSFNEKVEPTVTLNTASLALLETLDKLNENGFISNKGAFVVKILLNNKAVKHKKSDKYKTVVAPFKASKDGIMLENIKLR